MNGEKKETFWYSDIVVEQFPLPPAMRYITTLVFIPLAGAKLHPATLEQTHKTNAHQAGCDAQ